MDKENTAEIHARINDLVEQQLWGQAASEITNLPPADIAEILSRYNKETTAAMFNVLPDSLKADVLAHLEPEIAAEVTESIPSEQVSEIMMEMDPDDAADILGELDEDVMEQVVGRMDADDAEDVRKLMTYPEDSAGGIMTTDLITMRPDQTILDALDAIAGYEEGESIYQIYVVDSANRLIGVVPVWELLRHKVRSTPLFEIMRTEIVSVKSNDDQEDVARTIHKYSMHVIPVLDETGVLIGRITHDDVIDVIKEEAEEDIFRLAGSDDDELGNASILKSCAIRLPWLLITLLGGGITALLSRRYSIYFGSVLVLAAFIPNIMGMGGNTGLQSSTLLVREIASGTARRQPLGALIRHEVRTGALMGVICGAGIYIAAIIIISLEPTATSVSPWLLAGVVAVSLFCAMSFAAGFGALIPVILDRIRIDPAVASGPFISVLNDISALTIYYGVSVALLSAVL